MVGKLKEKMVKKEQAKEKLGAALRRQAKKADKYTMLRFFNRFGLDQNWAGTARELAQGNDDCKEKAVHIFLGLGMKEEAIQCIESVEGTGFTLFLGEPSNSTRASLWDHPKLRLEKAELAMKKGAYVEAAKCYADLGMEDKVLECASVAEKEAEATEAEEDLFEGSDEHRKRVSSAYWEAAKIYLSFFKVPMKEDAVRCIKMFEEQEPFNASEMYGQLGMKKEQAQMLEKYASLPFERTYHSHGDFSEYNKPSYRKDVERHLGEAAKIYDGLKLWEDAERVYEQLQMYKAAAQRYLKAGKREEIFGLIERCQDDPKYRYNKKYAIAQMHSVAGEKKTAAQMLVEVVKEINEIFLRGETYFGQVKQFASECVKACLEAGMEKEAADVLFIADEYIDAAKLYLELDMRDRALECAEEAKPDAAATIYHMLGMKDKAFDSFVAMGELELALDLLDEIEPIN